MEEQFVRDRITELRVRKDIPERKMSLDLGHSASYIHSIASGRALPSVKELLYICDYLDVTPMEFFKVDDKTTTQRERAIRYIYELSEGDTEFLVSFLERLVERGEKRNKGNKRNKENKGENKSKKKE